MKKAQHEISISDWVKMLNLTRVEPAIKEAELANKGKYKGIESRVRSKVARIDRRFQDSLAESWTRYLRVSFAQEYFVEKGGRLDSSVAAECEAEMFFLNYQVACGSFISDLPAPHLFSYLLLGVLKDLLLTPTKRWVDYLDQTVEILTHINQTGLALARRKGRQPHGDYMKFGKDYLREYKKLKGKAHPYNYWHIDDPLFTGLLRRYRVEYPKMNASNTRRQLKGFLKARSATKYAKERPNKA